MFRSKSGKPSIGPLRPKVRGLAGREGGRTFEWVWVEKERSDPLGRMGVWVGGWVGE